MACSLSLYIYLLLLFWSYSKVGRLFFFHFHQLLRGENILVLLLGGDEGGSESDTASRGTSGEFSEVLLVLSRVQGEEDSSPWSDALVSVVVVRSFEEGGGDGEGEGEGGVGVGAGPGAGAGPIGRGSGCTGNTIEGGSGGRHLEESDAAARRRLSSEITTASNVVRRQLLTALLAAVAASLLPILETSEVVFLALLLVVLPEHRTTPYSIPKGSLTISRLKYFTVAMPFSTAVYATLKLTSWGARTSVQLMERVSRVSRRARTSWVKPSPVTVLAIVGNERLCLGRKVSGCCWKARMRSVPCVKIRPRVTLEVEKVVSWDMGQSWSGSK
jgi:hypothetical protein